jgi:hypothetical protein
MSTLISAGITATALALIAWLLYANDRLRIRRLAASRKGESISTFLQSIEHRNLDSQVIRAVYHEVQNYFAYAHSTLPLRPSDSFAKEFDFDDGDLEKLVLSAAKRCGREMRAAELNPHFGKVETVLDLIEFLCAQPKQTNGEANILTDPLPQARYLRCRE